LTPPTLLEMAIFRQLPNSCHSEPVEHPANGTIERFATLLC
jgi:hypothetical protein